MLRAGSRVVARSPVSSLAALPSPRQTIRMTSSSASSSTLPPNLPALIAKQYDQAIANSAAFFYPSEIHTVNDESKDGQEVPLQWSVRRCEALRQKALEKKQKESAASHSNGQQSSSSGGQNQSDVFAPPYDQDLLIAELGNHSLLLNKFALIPHHFLLVTREFRPQHIPPHPSTLALSFQILGAMPDSRPENLLCFFNCGPESGASQAHCHMQFVDLKDGGGVLVEKLLERIERDGKEMKAVHALPLPYQHFVHLLPSDLSSSTPEALQETLGSTLSKLMDAMFAARAAAISADQPMRTGRGISWNLLLTKQAMHLIPREQEDFPLDQEVSAGDEVGSLSLNALCFAGHLVTKSNEEVDLIKAYPGGIRKILSEVARKPVMDFTVAMASTDPPSITEGDSNTPVSATTSQPKKTRKTGTESKCLIWNDGNSSSKGSFARPPQSVRSALQAHVKLSSQISQALFTSIQALHSTALPPAPILKPAELPESLQDLPLWSLSPQASPTVKELIPSLVLLHDSLDELLLRARTQRANYRRVQSLKTDVETLQSGRRARIVALRDASAELREIVARGQKEKENIVRARRAPLNYSDVLDYAAVLARTTSAPPGWSGAKQLQQQVAAALGDGLSEAKTATPAKQGAEAVEGSVKGEAVPTPKDQTADAVGSQAPAAEKAREKPKGVRVLNPEQDGPSATSAPHSLPFPSDADMRRGLMGTAMLNEEGGGPGYSGLLPSWQEWQERLAEAAKLAGEGVAEGQGAEGLDQADQSRDEAQSGAKMEVDEEDLGLDLN